jgi:hypothetical protein
MGPDDPGRLATLHASVSEDLDVIEAAASFAINNATLAVEPESYARTVMGKPDYTLTVLPQDLPRLVPGTAPFPLPDWGFQETMARGGDTATGQHIPSADELGLVISVIRVPLDLASDPDGVTLGDIVNMVPPAGTPVSRGQTIFVSIIQP